MKPIEKADELVEKFSPLVTTWDCYWDCMRDEELIKNDAAKCAIIAVEEILNEQVRNDYLTETAYREQKEYWNEVLTILKTQL